MYIKEIQTLKNKLYENSIINISGPITNETCDYITSTLLYLDSLNDRTPIQLYINSPGGCVTSGLAIYDTIRSIDRIVHTYCIGSFYSMAAILFAAGDKRYMLPHSTLMIHQPGTLLNGRFEDINTAYYQLKNINDLIAELLSKHSNKSKKDISGIIQKGDYYMSATEAIDFGIADEIVEESEHKKIKKGT